MIPCLEAPRRTAPQPAAQALAPAAVVSLLVHALAMVILAHWVLGPAARRQDTTPVSIRIERFLPPESTRGIGESRRPTAIPREGARDREIADTEPAMPEGTDQSPAAANSQGPAPGTLPEAEPAEPDGERLSDRVARSVARIVQELDAQDARFGSAPGIPPASPLLSFGSRQYGENGVGGEPSPPPGGLVEVIGISGDYARLRVGDRCWWLPVDAGSDPFDEKIALIDFDCPARTVIGLAP